ncbi:hypothetical protein GmRootV213_56290 (plasmid) [Variovorax sp. V213]
MTLHTVSAAPDAPLWTPAPGRKERALITHFEAWLDRERGLRFENYEALWQWSVTDLEGFWSAVLAFFELPLRTPYERILSGEDMPGARWFEGARLNLVDQVFRHAHLASPSIVFESEASGTGAMSWCELQRQVECRKAVVEDRRLLADRRRSRCRREGAQNGCSRQGRRRSQTPRADGNNSMYGAQPRREIQAMLKTRLNALGKSALKALICMGAWFSP